jgi:hypothetical protein
MTRCLGGRSPFTADSPAKVAERVPPLSLWNTTKSVLAHSFLFKGGLANLIVHRSDLRRIASSLIVSDLGVHIEILLGSLIGRVRRREREIKKKRSLRIVP